FQSSDDGIRRDHLPAGKAALPSLPSCEVLRAVWTAAQTHADAPAKASEAGVSSAAPRQQDFAAAPSGFGSSDARHVGAAERAPDGRHAEDAAAALHHRYRLPRISFCWPRIHSRTASRGLACAAHSPPSAADGSYPQDSATAGTAGESVKPESLGEEYACARCRRSRAGIQTSTE